MSGPQQPRASVILYYAWLTAMMGYCLVRLTEQREWFAPATAITIALWLATAVASALERHRPARTSAMLLSGFGIALLFEYLGSEHGLIFGDYDYTDLLGPRAFGAVPVLIPAAWFMMLYPSWEIAGLLTAGRRWLRIPTAAAAMTAWDLSLDPRMVADGAWIWPNGGAYFGIPLSNFVGWFVTAAVIFVLWSMLDTSWRPKGSNLPIAVYVTTWLGESGANALFWSGPVVGAIVFAAMGAFAAPALALLLRRSHGARTAATAAGIRLNALLNRVRPPARIRNLKARQAAIDGAQHQIRTAAAPTVEGHGQVHSRDLA